jgi:hypothetical protein
MQGMVAENLIAAAALDSFALPLYCRSKLELLEPVTNGELKKELSVDHFQLHSVQCPLQAQYKKDGDAARYAHGLTGILRAFTEPILARRLFGLTERRKSSLDASIEQKVIELIYQRVEGHISEAPDSYTFYPCHATMIFTKLT